MYITPSTYNVYNILCILLRQHIMLYNILCMLLRYKCYFQHLPPLSLLAKVELAPNGQVELQLGMIRKWKGPMRLKYISFVNVQMEMGVAPGKLLNKLGIYHLY